MSLGSDEKITLDRRTFKVLASNTRTQILKALEGTQKTVSDLARELSMNKATMYQHLEQLREVGLVKRLDGEERLKTVKAGPHEAPMDGSPRKWVYYKLSWKGKNIVNPGRVRFAVMLSIIGVIGIAFVLLFAATVIYTPPEPGDALNDVEGPTFDVWDTPTPNTKIGQGNDVYSFSVDVSDSPLGGKVTGLKQESVHLYYGVGTHETLQTPDVVGWTELDKTDKGGGVFSASISDLDWADMGGRYLYLKVTAEDMAGNSNQTVRVLYIVAFNESDLIFGDNGIFPDNGLYGDKGIFVQGGGGSGGGAYVFGAQVTNMGTSASSSTKVTVYSTDPDLDGDGFLDFDKQELDAHALVTFNVPSLEPGETMNLTDQQISRTELVKLDPVSSSAAHVYFVIDPDNDIDEADEANNIQKVLAEELMDELEHNRPSPTKESGDALGGAPGFEAAIFIIATLVVLAFVDRKYRKRQ